MPQIGPWTVQCLGLFGRGELDSLPAGDLGYIKLVGRLAGVGRRATVPEVEEFYAPYEPYRGLVGALTLAGLYRLVAQGPPLRLGCLRSARQRSSARPAVRSDEPTVRCAMPADRNWPDHEVSDSSTRSPRAGTTTGAWSSGCR